MTLHHAASSTAPPAGRGPRSTRASVVIAASALLAFLACAGFIALGTWQLQRLAWKLDLVARIEQRIHAPATPPPALSQWAAVSQTSDEYRRIQTTGRFLNALETRVQAVTERGSGFWVLVPLQHPDGTAMLVNRGFVPADAPSPAAPAAADATGLSTVAGLLRLSEPGGGFLRHNDPAARRWYSRDVAAIGAALGLQTVAPYFMDADAAPAPSATGPHPHPVGGLTVVRFHNNHLVYALTWYALALMVAAAAWYVRRSLKEPVDASTD